MAGTASDRGVTYSIGQLADAAGVHLETVRYYERRGLIAEPPRSPSGYRQYSGEDVWRLRFIGRAKGLGFTLAEIADILGDGASPRDADRILSAARTKIEVIEAQQAELADTQRRLHRLVVACTDGDADCLNLFGLDARSRAR